MYRTDDKSERELRAQMTNSLKAKRVLGMKVVGYVFFHLLGRGLYEICVPGG